ncbi:unnamed protein product [Rotaria sp. Silwood1]|nr:unnamed protein product [Rotaria sp. Silwood1]
MWKKRNNQISFSSLSTLVDKDVDEQVFLNEDFSKELCDILEYWHDNRSLNQNQQDKFRKYSQYLLNVTKNNGEATQWLNQQTRLTDLAKKCADDIASHGYYLDIEGTEDPNLQSFDWLIQAYTNTECDQLIDIIVRCVSNRFYTKTLYNLDLVHSDDIKQEIVEQYALPSIIQYTKKATNDPAPLEVAYALSFNADAKKVFSEDRDFVDHVEKLRQSDNKEVANAAYGVIWKLEDEEKFMKEVEEKKSKEQSTEKLEEAAGDKQKPEKALGDEKKPKEAADDGKKTKEATDDEKKSKEKATAEEKHKEEADKEDEEFEKAYELLMAEIKRQDLDEAATDEPEKSAGTSSTEPKPEPVPEEIEPQPIQTREYLTMSSAMMWTKENVNEFLLDNELQPLVPLCKSMDGATLIEFHQSCQTLPTEMYSLVNKSKEEHPVTLDIFFRFICKMKQYLPPPKPPAKIFFRYHFIYENQK